MTGRVLAFTAFVAFGCSDGDAARALEAAAPFREEHRRFAQWAQRTLESEAGRPRSREDLEETLFAPLFLESQVLGARVTRDGRVHAHGEVVPSGLEWQRARGGDEELRVAELRVGTTPAVALATERGDLEVVTLYRRAE